MYKSFKDMPIWRTAMDIAEKIFILTKNLPKNEDYSLTAQIRRSSLSISSNIAEGFGRKHSSDKNKFYYYARGSVYETLSHLEYGIRVGYFNSPEISALDKSLQILARDLNMLISKIQANQSPAKPQP